VCATGASQIKASDKSMKGAERATEPDRNLVTPRFVWREVLNNSRIISRTRPQYTNGGQQAKL